MLGRGIIALLISSTFGCGVIVDESTGAAALNAEGWSEVNVTEKHFIVPLFYGCDKNDSVAFEARGLNPAGRPSSAVVCCGAFFKGCTIRH